MKLEILNVSRIEHVCLTEKTFSSDVDLNKVIRDTYYKDPVRLRIRNQRHALERAMLHFANYEESTTKIDEDTYECLIYYNQVWKRSFLLK